MPVVGRTRGVTLGEVLVATAIVAALAAILIPIFVSARRSALGSAVTSNLAQIGRARALYMADHDEAVVIRTAPLVRAGLVTRAQLRNPLDPYKEGFVAEQERGMRDSEGNPMPRDPEDLGGHLMELGSWMGEILYPYHQDQPAAGWIVVPHFRKAFKPHDGFFPEGPYSRLTLGGAVLVRTYIGAGRTRFGSDDVFFDGDVDLLDLYRRDHPEFDRYH
ncbi:hypothetical protein EON77_05250 [bacterium]|nr:MAG: hypothetical protein EON77_05250 [bacterium]